MCCLKEDFKGKKLSTKILAKFQVLTLRHLNRKKYLNQENLENQDSQNNQNNQDNQDNRNLESLISPKRLDS